MKTVTSAPVDFDRWMKGQKPPPAVDEVLIAGPGDDHGEIYTYVFNDGTRLHTEPDAGIATIVHPDGKTESLYGQDEDNPYDQLTMQEYPTTPMTPEQEAECMKALVPE